MGVRDRIELAFESWGRLVRAMRAVVDRYDGPDFRLFTVGGAVIATEITEHMTEDVASYISVTALAIMAVLLFLFRRVPGVIYPMVVVAAFLIANLGTMVWLDIPFSLILGMLPIFTMCVGVCNAVRVLVIVYQRLAAGESREEAIAYAFGHSGLAISMTGLTTAAGMLSFLIAELVPVRHLGITAPVGVLFAFLFAMTPLPALVAIVPLGRASRAAGPKRASWSERFLVWTGELSVRRSAAVPGVGLLIIGAVSAGLGGVRFAHKPMDWFPEDDQPVQHREAEPPASDGRRHALPGLPRRDRAGPREHLRRGDHPDGDGKKHAAR